MDVNKLSTGLKQNKRKTFHAFDHKYYGPLTDSYTKTILQSGLLLDEDLEVLLNIVHFKSFPQQNECNPSLPLLASFLSVLGSSLLARKYNSFLIAMPSVIVNIGVIALKIKDVRKKKAHRYLMNNIIDVLKKNHKQNNGVIRYMKTRTDVGKAKGQEFLLTYNNHVKEFIENFLKSENEYLSFLTETLKTISSYSDDLVDDYNNLKLINYVKILEEKKINTMEDCLTLTQKIQDLNILFASKLLNYIGVVLYSSYLEEKDMENILNIILPNLLNYLQKYYSDIKKLFIILKQSVNKKSEYQSQNKVDANKHISSKLEDTLMYSVNNLSIILEKSQNILEAVENNGENCVNEVGNALVDLRDHTLATYESLDLLCKLYGILSNSKRDKIVQNNITNVTQTETTSENILPVVNYDDTSEPVEEKYELFISEKDVIANETTGKICEDSSSAYLSLMLQELKQSLKQHQRFIDAKARRGSEETDDTEYVVKTKKSTPKFNLEALNEKSIQKDFITPPPLPSIILSPSDTLGKDIVALPAKECLPPPPPPIPTFSLGDVQEESGQVNTRSMLDNIKLLSDQINVQEDVFGDSDVDSELSD